VKKGWVLKSLGDVAEVIPGQSPKGANYNTRGKGVPFYQGKKEFGDRLIGEPTTWTTQVTRLAKADDILMSVRAPVGPVNLATQDVCIGRGLAAIRPGAALDTAFLFHYLVSQRNQIEGNEGAVFASINRTQIEAIPVPIPPLPEQRRIVAILDEAIEGIAAAKANAEQNRRNAREVFEGQMAEVFAEPSGEWESTTIGGAIRFIDYRGKTPTKTESGLRLITAKNVKMGRLLDDPAEYVAPSSYMTWMTRGIPKKGDILFTTEAPLANVAELDTDDKVVFAQRIIIMQPDEQSLYSPFVKYMLMSAPVQSRIHRQGTGATVKGIKSSLLKQIPIQFPSTLREQRHIAEMLAAVEADSAELSLASSRKLAALDELKASFLHQAFTGAL
jgi:type I restriction enzyme S subunit